jgi:hypothetical protein
MRNAADSNADLERFVRRVAERDEVWALQSPQGFAYCDSNEFEDEDGEASTVLLFFSDRAYAARAQAAHFPEYVPATIPLFDFLFRWLPGMSGDARLAGPNWSGDLTGREVDPFELRELIEAGMTPELQARHRALYEELSGNAAG